MATKKPEVNRLEVEVRDEFGKGSARRLRAAGRVPGVLYSNGEDNIHFHVDILEITALVRNDGTNAILELEVEGDKNQFVKIAVEKLADPARGCKL